MMRQMPWIGLFAILGGLVVGCLYGQSESAHGLVGLRPLPRTAAQDHSHNHGGSWAGTPTYAEQQGHYLFVAEHLDVVKGWLDGDFKTKTVFFEYYWGLDEKRDDLDPGKNFLIKTIRDSESKGGIAERGFAHVGFLGNNPWRESKVIYDAFAASAKALGMQLHAHRFRAFSDESRIPKLVRMEQEFTDWLRKTPQPLGLMAAGDWRAIRFCNWALRAGFRIPEELAVMGRGDHLSICEGSIPSISSFDLDEEKRIRTACDVLARMMAGEKGPTMPIYIAPKGVIERESTHVLATSDPVVAAALRYMWDHLERDVSIENVAAQVAVSSRQLERRFRQALGRTVNEELRRKRMEEGRRLLRTTDAAIADIVPMIGFRSTAYFHNIFRKSFGTTPLKYRREARTLASTP
ncbi:MAG: substrate-binding domain-containing protein [Kiritimatiellia bacterium]